jgi:hypothetical protein
MSALSIQPPYPTFEDAGGQPLEDGYIWIGTVNLNPITNPIVVYWDSALTIPAVQPIRTSGGYPVYQGTPARLYVNSDYSIQVQNKNGSMVYSAPAATERYSDVVIPSLDASSIAFTQIGSTVQQTVQSKLERYLDITDYGCVGDGITDNLVAFQKAINEAGDSGIKRLYVPAGTYMLQLTGGIGVQDSNGAAINGFEIFGEGDASIFKVGLNSGVDFQAILGFGIYTTGVTIRDLSFDFNVARVALRPSPSARFHNPAIMMSRGGRNVRIINCSFLNASVDQPIRLASFTVPAPLGEKVDDVLIDGVRFYKFGDGIPGNNQDDISCIFAVANAVRIVNSYWESGINNLTGSKGLTAIECYGSHYVIANNDIKQVMTAHIVGNDEGPDFTDNILITGNNYYNALVLMQTVARGYSTKVMQFSNNRVTMDSGCLLSQPAFLDANFTGGAQPAFMEALIIKNNVFNYTNSQASNPGSSYASLILSSNTGTVEFSGNYVNGHPAGIFYNFAYTGTQPNLIFRNNTLKNIRTDNAKAGNAATAWFYEANAGVVKTIDFTGNHVENWMPKADRAGTGYTGPLVAILFNVNATNVLINYNTILGVNAALSSFHGTITSENTTGNINGTQTD